MAEKTIKTRIQHKREFETNWLRAANFVPLAGELIVYQRETDLETGNVLTTQQNGEEVSVLTGLDRTVPYNYDRLKFGDGKTRVNDLPFVKYVDEHVRGIMSTPALPANAEADDNVIYKVITAIDVVVTQNGSFNQPAYVVKELPTTGNPYALYYCLSDGECYGFVDENTDGSDGTVPVEYGWYDAVTALDLWSLGESFRGIVTDIDSIDTSDTYNWDTHFLYLQHELYHYTGGRFAKIYDSETSVLQAHILPQSAGGNYGCDVSAAVMHDVISSGGTVILNDLSRNQYLPQSMFGSYVIFNSLWDDMIVTHWEIWDQDGETYADVVEKQLIASDMIEPLHVYLEETELGGYSSETYFSAIRNAINEGREVLLHVPTHSGVLLPTTVMEDAVFFQYTADDLVDCEVWYLCSDDNNKTTASRTLYDVVTRASLDYELDLIKDNSTKVQIITWEDDD